MNRKWVLFGVLVVIPVVALVGCSNNSTVPTQKAAAPQSGEAKPDGAKGDEHAHKPGTHGGTIVALGKDSYHAEAVFEKGGKVRLYMLGKEETRVQQVEAQTLSAFVTPEGSTDAVPVAFKPEPQQGDAAGTTSLFVAALPEGLAGKKVQVTINNINVGGERFRIGFGNEAHGDAMPAKKATAEEQKLFLTPGGLYTAADIKANGDTIPAVKYRGIRPTHQANLTPGQKICPISRTASNPKFTWVIGGKTYEFCCIPCIEEFLTTAKEKPAEIKDPSEYVKK
ncbi:hypothetical protein R5W24_002397 [Gemmata sp. JC717]|uniref:hypothetical protein n=1 Tax=Gemmata algarum TaxID=2975278 RepID=UPI0021BA478F|nr:hypothetical protein [Gemmata algarum]MDY3553298.1 hypothetical protein [Gemmata algarum]